MMEFMDRVPMFLWLAAWGASIWFAVGVGQRSREEPSEEGMRRRLVELEFRRVLLKNVTEDVDMSIKNGAEDKLFKGDV